MVSSKDNVQNAGWVGGGYMYVYEGGYSDVPSWAIGCIALFKDFKIMRIENQT